MKPTAVLPPSQKFTARNYKIFKQKHTELWGNKTNKNQNKTNRPNKKQINKKANQITNTHVELKNEKL